MYDTLTAACTIFSKTRLGVGGVLLMAVPDRRDKQVLWIATKGSGIIKFNVSTGSTEHFTEAKGLPNNVVYYIAPDRRGFFWCSSNKGIFRFDPVRGTVTSFTVKDGLQGNEFNRYHFLETNDGHFAFGGTEGYTVFHPDSILTDHFITPVVISNIMVNNQPLQKAIPAWKGKQVSSLSHITLAHDQNLVSISFAGLEYDDPEKLQYRYMLDGIDDEWVYAGNTSTASYAYIPPGRYTFKVNASNTAGEWSNQVKTLAIVILPPWWKTMWAYSFYLIALAGIFYALYRNWINRVRDKQQIILKQQEAQQAHVMEEMKSRFFANITHEFRTPLTLIMSPVEKQLRENGATYSPALLQGVYQQSRQLLRLINQLLDMSKLEAGNMPLTFSRGDIAMFVEELVGAFRPEADAKNISLSYHRHDAVPGEVIFDSDKLEKIVYNLLSNAIKFTPAGGSVSVVLSQQQTTADKYRVQLRVEDTGIGIPSDQLPHIFKRFYQVSNAATRRYEGTGIGLSLVEEFLSLMGGEVWVESTPGKGAAFTISLLLQTADREAGVPPFQYNLNKEMPAALQEPAKELSITDGEARQVVLVVEDNKQLLSFIQTSLAPHYQVLTAGDGEAGLRMAEAELPDMVVSDVMMPVMDGYELCRRIKENPLTSHTGFIMLTAKAADESRMAGLRLGADHYLSKPFIVDELLLVMANLFTRQQKLREHHRRQLGPEEKLQVPNEVNDSFLQSVYTIIENSLDDPMLDVEFLSSRLAVSRRTLNRKLSALLGMPPNEIIRNYRLKKSAELLLKGYPVTESAYMTGFSTPSWFTQCFKDLYGITPVKYVENNRLSQN